MLLTKLCNACDWGLARSPFTCMVTKCRWFWRAGMQVENFWFRKWLGKVFCQIFMMGCNQSLGVCGKLLPDTQSEASKDSEGFKLSRRQSLYCIHQLFTEATPCKSKRYRCSKSWNTSVGNLPSKEHEEYKPVLGEWKIGIDSFRLKDVNVILVAAIYPWNPWPFWSANASGPRDIMSTYHRITQGAPKTRASLLFVITPSITPSLFKFASSTLLFPST